MKKREPIAVITGSRKNIQHQMSCMRYLYDQLLKFGYSRRCARRLRAKIQNLFGYTDPYYDLARIAGLAEATLFMDIGCHDGRTLQRFIESGVKAKIAAFDPLPNNIERAKGTLSAYADKIQFIEAALSDEEGNAVFYVNENDQTSSLLDNDVDNVAALEEHTMHKEVIKVPTIKLDTWIKQHGIEGHRLVIKSDAQGAEGKIIAGGIETFKKSVCAFYGEVMLGAMYEGQANFQDLRDMLETECGMILKNIYPCLHDSRGQAIQMDALWVKEDFLQ